MLVLIVRFFDIPVIALYIMIYFYSKVPAVHCAVTKHYYLMSSL